MPVWIWLSNVITAHKRWKNTHYVVTNKRIVIQSGFIGIDYQSIYYKDIHSVYLDVGVIDKCLSVGDIYFELIGQISHKGQPAFLDIADAFNVYQKIQQIVLEQNDI